MVATVIGPQSTPHRPARWLARVFCHECARPFEVAVALMTLATGLWLLAPAHTFDSTVAFAGFRWMGDRPAGWVLVALASVVLIGPRHARTPAVWALAIVWGYAAWLFLLGNPAGLGWLWAGGYAATALWSLLAWRHWEGRR